MLNISLSDRGFNDHNEVKYMYSLFLVTMTEPLNNKLTGVICEVLFDD